MAIKVEEALDIIYKNITPTSIKFVPIEQSLGHVLAEDIVAKHNLPPFDNSAMDGYAVKLQDAGKTVEISDTIFAGDNCDAQLQEGVAIKIMTGAKIPSQCDAIVPVENTSMQEDKVLLPENIKLSQHIRKKGEDIESGEILLKKGKRLFAHQITLLASQGISHIKVHKKPRIALFASGSELKMHFETVASHQLYNTNTQTFYSRALELGCDVDFVGTAIDTLEDIKEHITNALDSDLIITSGGVSVGDADYTKEAFHAFGYDIFFDKIDIKPGKPTTIGKIGNTVILNLPGNPLAAALNFELFGSSIIHALSGDVSKYLTAISTKMKVDYKTKPGRRTLIPGYFDGETFNPCEKFAPGMVSPLANSNSYIMLSEDCAELKSGDLVKVIPTRFIFTSCKDKGLVTQSPN